MGRGHGFKSTWANDKYCKPKQAGGSGGGIEEAPSDGVRYVRRNGQWEAIPYATKEDTINLSSSNKAVTPKALSGLLDDMGVTKDEESGKWSMDQGELT